MRTPLAPVGTGAGKAAPAGLLGGHVDTPIGKTGGAVGSGFERRAVQCQQAAPDQPLEHPHRQFARHMVVAGAGVAHVDRHGAHRPRHGPLRRADLRDVGECFDGRGNVRRRDPEVAVPAAHFEREQAAVGQTRQMGAGRRRREPGDHCQLTGWAGAAVHQRPQHRGAAGVGEQRTDTAQAWEMVVFVCEVGGHQASPVGGAGRAPCSPLYRACVFDVSA